MYALAPYLAPPIWFMFAALMLYFVASIYFHLLCALGGSSRTARVLMGALLWLGFAVIGVAPLFGWIAIAKAYLPAMLEGPAVLWSVLCFGLCFVAIHRAMKPRLRQLQSLGMFRK